MIQADLKSRSDLNGFKRKMAKKYQIPCPKNIDLLQTYHKLLKQKSKNSQCLGVRHPNIEEFLRIKPVRSLSGIVNVSVLTKPYPCPGKCIFCPEQKGIPKSYLAQEPAVQRAVLTKFSPSKQVSTRLESLTAIGHPIDKVELRIIGGTWSYYPRQYQTWFVEECFKAANKYLGQTHGKPKSDLKTLQKRNEKAKARIIGITIETRPDYIDLDEIKQLRKLGVTRVELGAQTVYDNVLKLNKRGHGIKETIKATKLLKDAGFKVSYQMMPNLAGSSFKKDTIMFKEIFSNPDFKPDLLKIYPLALLKQAPLYKWYKQGRFKPYTEKQLIKLLTEIKKHIPYWCRIERIIRDIPSIEVTAGGVKTSNLREVVQKTLLAKGEKCKCIRCREVGKDYDSKEKLKLFRQDYQASGAKEVFLSFENKTRSHLYALLRLRLPMYDVRHHTLAVLKNTAIVRELHTYGQLTPIGDKTASAQHKGMGRKLIRKAEKIAKQAGFKKIAVISGIGARGYYRTKLSYKLKDTYMLKRI